MVRVLGSNKSLGFFSRIKKINKIYFSEVNKIKKYIQNKLMYNLSCIGNCGYGRK